MTRRTSTLNRPSPASLRRDLYRERRRAVVEHDLVHGRFEDGADVNDPDRFRPSVDPLVESIAVEIEDRGDVIACRQCLVDAPRPAIYGHDCRVVILLRRMDDPGERTTSAMTAWGAELIAAVKAGKLHARTADDAWRTACR